MSEYDFTLKTKVGHYEVQIDPVAMYGWFEHDELGDESGGGLWFDGDELMDYDGIFELPMPVIEAIRQLGLTVDEEFEL